MTNKELKEALNQKAQQLEDLPIRTVDEHNEYVKSIQKEEVGRTKLSILIATTIDRRDVFNILMLEFHKQIEVFGFAGKGLERWYVKTERLNEDGSIMLKEDGTHVTDMAVARYRHKGEIEILFDEDNKEISIGAKRQKLLDKSKGEYIVYFDSDDFPNGDYIKEIMKALEEKPDCVGLKIQMTTNGQKPQTCIHSLKNPEWKQKGDDYLRNVTHFNPVLRSLAIQVGFEDKRYGEDKVYSDKVSKLCKKEVFIDKHLFNYRYSNQIEHNIKYGITK